jgi:hypothetical protein
MSEFDKLMAIADDALFHTHGDSGFVTLRPRPDQPEIPLAHAIVSDETAVERDQPANKQLVMKRIITISTNPDCAKYSGVQDPQRMGTFLVGPVEYQVFEITRSSNGVANIEGRRYGVLGVQRRNYEGGDY